MPSIRTRECMHESSNARVLSSRVNDQPAQVSSSLLALVCQVSCDLYCTLKNRVCLGMKVCTCILPVKRYPFGVHFSLHFLQFSMDLFHSVDKEGSWQFVRVALR